MLSQVGFRRAERTPITDVLAIAEPSTARASDLAGTARIAGALICGAAMTAIVVHITAAGEARQLLGLTFPGLPRRLSESLAIFLNNVRVLFGVLVACVLAHLTGHTDNAPRSSLAAPRAVTLVCDIVLAVGYLFHVLLVGATVGAYGERGLAAMLPHGPLELTAFSLGLSAYLAARRGRLTRRALALSAALAVAALAVGAVLEVFGR
jgi:hypothetical protein